MGNIIWEWDTKKLQDGRPHWFVLTSGFGHDKIYDVLSHPYIVDICATSGKHVKFSYFNDRLKRACFCEFASRAQYEMGFSDKFPFINAEEIDRLVAERNKHPDQLGFEVVVRGFTSVDVYNQLVMNWDAFARYTFAHRTEIVAAAKERHDEFMAKLAAHKASQSN